jgi:hypothetical protein
MNKSDIRTTLEDMATRYANGERAMVECIMGLGAVTKDQAEKVLAAFRKAKVLKRDSASGTLRVKHGALLDRDVIQEIASR